jgi:hypothetical protein
LAGILMAAQDVPEVRTSERTTFRKCRQAWWWGYREGLVRKGPPAPALWFGIGIHEVLAAYYQKGRKRASKTAVLNAWKRYCETEYVPMRTYEKDEAVEYTEALELGLDMLENYLRVYGRDEHMYILATEQTRRIPVYDRDGKLVCYYLYTMDGIYKDLDDHRKIKILEHKTAAAITLTHLTLDDQAGSYLAFESLMLGEDIQDITYNFLRKAKFKMDDRPTNAKGERLNKDGSVSARQSTQSDTLVRKDIPRSREARNQIVDRLIVEVNEMNACRRDPESHIYKNPQAGPMGCSTCPFREMCELHEEGADWEDYRDWNFKRQDPYGPYRKAA